MQPLEKQELECDLSPGVHDRLNKDPKVPGPSLRWVLGHIPPPLGNSLHPRPLRGQRAQLGKDTPVTADPAGRKQ